MPPGRHLPPQPLLAQLLHVQTLIVTGRTGRNAIEKAKWNSVI